MRSDEVHAVGALAADVIGGLAGFVERMHAAIAERAFTAVGPVAAPVRVAHDGIATGVYEVVRGANSVLPRVAAALLARGAGDDAAPLAASRGGRIALGAVNGLWGDTLDRDVPELAVRMTVRGDGAPPADASTRVVVFVHGLCESDEAWLRPADADAADPRVTFGEQLHAELGWSPVYLRYNSGLHVSDNGRRLAALLEDLVAAWPVPVDELALVGHSMGGLVARSACHYGDQAAHRWIAPLRPVVSLGTPHLGAPLEKAVHLAAWVLGRVPETRPFAEVVNGRSAGVKDLRFGAVVEDDWLGHDPDEFLRNRCTEVPFLPSATYCFIGVTLARDPDGPLARVLGDALVRYPSASGRSARRTIGFEIDRGVHLGGLHHLDLLQHPAVYDQLRTWLRNPAASPQPTASPPGP
jgi:hypothetical protein